MNKLSLWRNSDFVKLWSAQTISAIGSKVSFLALPLTALFVLQATPVEMGYLSAAGSLPALLFGLLAGVWVDRRKRRSLLVLADWGRGLLLLLIPLAAWFGLLTMPLLYVIIFSTGSFSLLFGTAYHAYLPSLVQREQQVDANSKLAFSRTAAEIVGPSLAGWLVQGFSAPLALLADAFSFLLSGLCLGQIRQPEIAPKRDGAVDNLLGELGAGIRLLRANATLRAITVATATLSFFNAALEAIYLLYMTRELGLSSALIGLIFSAGSLGFLSGALLSTQAVSRFGLGPTMIAGLGMLSLADFVLPLAVGPQPLIIGLLITAQICFGFGLTFYHIGQESLRQAITPEAMLGRLNGTLDFVVAGLLPIGALVGGLLGGWLGLRPTLLLAVSGELLAALWLLISPVRTTR